MPTNLNAQTLSYYYFTGQLTIFLNKIDHFIELCTESNGINISYYVYTLKVTDLFFLGTCRITREVTVIDSDMGRVEIPVIHCLRDGLSSCSIHAPCRVTLRLNL